MKYDTLIIRYGEIALKGRNRKSFYDTLYDRVREQLLDLKDIKLKKRFDHIEVVLNGMDYQQVADRIRHVFGIQSMRVAITVDNDLESIHSGALRVIKEEEHIATFKVSARRKNKDYPMTSKDLNYSVGSFILKNTENVTVDVHHPDMNLQIEVLEDTTRIYGKVIKGAGGLPVGSAGKVMLMLSGGIDSPVAGYMMMRRGATVEAIHFHSPPYTNDRAKQKVLDLAAALQKFGGRLKLHVVPFTNAQIAIRDRMPENYRMTIMRRMMLRIAERLAVKREALGIATGESLGQVASQTLESMNTINEVTNYPVFRPLVSTDKVDIIEIAKNIGTYDISIRPYEDCCTIFLPKAPKTKPKREQANRFEKNLPIEELMEEALAGVETIDVGKQTEALEDLL
ncbi:putative tRNA sulfurtransferase [Pullulanibacillus camelliae]|uniref:Probable tRNA sulfurtransferase n=1 Tax=Pullulanibacillus camelliae TaxID=1707096 RepID=A0A8J2YM26_9BACL|nr:tRNA uracil 4-sulfurtransferase ThiI [Pullulanibacillus camelliae]GGE52176.1 putative tRNA sulfurtransferase [Pullulanibacillus camelliae]